MSTDKNFKQKIIIDWLNYFIKFNKIPSVALSISDVESSSHYIVGNYDTEQKIKANENSIYGIGSLTKIFTTVKILKCIDEGKIKLDDKVISFISQFPDREPSILDLLTHRSGLSNHGSFDIWLDENLPSDDEVVSLLVNENMATKGIYKYSNLGFALLGIILKKFGKELNQIEIENVKSYGNDLLSGKKQYNFVKTNAFLPSYGKYSNLKDLDDFAKAILQKKSSLLTKESFDIFFKEYFKYDEEFVSLGFNKWEDENVYYISGSTYGSESFMLIDFDNNIALCALINSNKYKASFLANGLRKFELLSRDKNLINSEKYGFYRNKNYEVIAFESDESIMLINPAEGNPFYNIEEYPLQEDGSYLTVDQSDPYYKEKLTIEKDLNGNITSIMQGGWRYKKFDIVF